MLERENAAIINASLAELSREVVRSFRQSLETLEIDAPFYLSQNDGTLMNADFAEEHPVLTFASGPTNSMRGAAYLSGVKDGVVADIGGTTTDVGVLAHGFPRESSTPANIGGVRTNFRMPDVLSVGLGGGSHVRSGEQVTVGPDSVGFRLSEQGVVFGGDILTASDIAVAGGRAKIGDPARIGHLAPSLIESGLDAIHLKLEKAVDRVKTSSDEVPLVLVGGGTILISRPIAGTSKVVVPENAAVANAIGAAIAQVGGEVDRVFAYDEIGRDAAIQTATAEAVSQAIEAGAIRETVQTVDVEEVHLQYIPGGVVRLRVRVVGDLEIG
jgi:N-methylhydantoinase A/oxoprolinase/acetone carboxylase beta subunit